MSLEARITKTCMFATRGKNAGWQRYDEARKSFPDMKAAREWLRAEYGTAKRAPCYIDQKNGSLLQVGYVIGFRPQYRSKGDAMLEQHWISFSECKPLDVSAAAIAKAAE